MTEADLCASFIQAATKDGTWVAYPETAGYDILMRRVSDDVQIGIEAKLQFNAHVVVQALPWHTTHYSGFSGPDYLAILIPADKQNGHLETLCQHLGITVIRHHIEPQDAFFRRNPFKPDLPTEKNRCSADDWHEWAPDEREKLPDYVPDVRAGASAPVALTDWKVKAIKLCIILEERPVTRRDFKHLQLSPTMWTGRHGWLQATPAGYIAKPSMRDLRRQHPRNYEEIRADKAKWWPPDLLT